MTEKEAFIILSSIPYVGAVKIRYLIEKYGSASLALKVNQHEISLLPGFERVAKEWANWKENKDLERQLTFIDQHNVQVIPFTDAAYPQALLEISDYPILLYIKGKLQHQDRRSIAVVGTRNASIYGTEMATEISTQLASNGFTVVSGLARGIDTAAHLGALTNGRTLAVIGSGLANIYPPENRNLAERIVDHGALISEFSLFTPPDRQNFPQRNRIVSGMTMGTLLIEAPIKSGAMITMKKALDYRRRLFALPGRADVESFRGNHLLIKNGQAHLVENAQDILAFYQESLLLPPTSVEKKIKFDAEEICLLDHMPSEEINIEALVSKCSLPIQHINRILMSLMLKRAIKEFPGKIYKKLAAGNDKTVTIFKAIPKIIYYLRE